MLPDLDLLEASAHPHGHGKRTPFVLECPECRGGAGRKFPNLLGDLMIPARSSEGSGSEPLELS